MLTQTVSNYFLSVYQLHYAIRTETAYLRLVTAAMWPQNNRWGSEGGLILPLNPSRPVLALWPWRCSQNVLKLGTETEAEPWISRQTLRETILTDSQSQGSEKPKTECSGSELVWAVTPKPLHDQHPLFGVPSLLSVYWSLGEGHMFVWV